MPQALDLFAGCGGLSLGFEAAGFEVVGAYEADKWAADTYKHNFPGARVEVGDLTSHSLPYWKREYGGVDVVMGGPPCQGFSVSGKRQYGEVLESTGRVGDFVNIVKTVRPRVFLFENVAGFRSADLSQRTPALRLVLSLESAGYAVDSRVLQATAYGVPSLRSRVFVVGTLGSAVPVPFPEPTHGGNVSDGKLPLVGVMDAIGDLPAIRAREGTNDFQPYSQGPTSPYQASMRGDSAGVYNHEAMKHTRRLVERFAGTPPGGSGYEIGRSRHADKPTATVYKSNNQRLFGDRPSLCITANFQSSYIHPVLDRNLTAREAARLMTFPDRYFFCGRRTLMSAKLLAAEGRSDENHLSQYNQIGNAVPPLLARRLAERLLEELELRQGHRDSGR